MVRVVKSVAGCLILMLLASGKGLAAEPVNHAAVLAPFVNGDTFAVGYIDVAPMKRIENSGQLFFLLPHLPSDVQSWAFMVMMADGFVRRFQDAGGQAVYVVAGLGDVRIGGGPVVVATARPGGHPEDVAQLFRDMMKEMTNNPSQKVAAEFVQQLAVEQKGDAVLLGTKPTVARYAAHQAAARADLVDPLTRLSGEGAAIAAVFCPGPDFRRVVRELWPELPGSLAPLRGELADRWLRFEIAVNQQPETRVRAAMEARDAEAAELFARLWRNLPTATTEFGDDRKAREQVKGYAQLLVDIVPAKTEGNRVVFDMPTEEARAASLRKMFGQALEASTESTRRRERVDRFHNIVLGLLNFESAKKHLPPAAICDNNGRPLLSWRVAILPYLEEGKLYKQFHLDEPWDSPHNRALIDKMPAVYMDLGSKSDQLNHEGKTTCQVPTGPQTIFFKKEGTNIREITDGTSRTIMVVEVDPKRAVEWTKPQDWDVDLDHPRQGIERADRGQFVAAFADGSVQILPTNMDQKKLRAYLTRAGRDAIEQP